MAKKTAVEWFYNKIKSHFEHDGDLLETLTFTMAIAKKKEREQLVNAHLTGLIYPLETEATKKAEQYYNETFGDVV
jgi:hypothetical protein